MKKIESADAAATTSFTTRWFLRLSSTFDPAFTSRTPVEEVGFFNTTRGAESVIQRFTTTSVTDDTPIRYFIKGVPEEYKAGFEDALNDWIQTFTDTVGKKMIAYEFVDVDDPRYEQIVTGDIRYNVIEWDTINKAPYGGLGPSIANQYTGQILSANVLIQGPAIITLYKKWYDAAQKIKKAESEGQIGLSLKLWQRFQKWMAAFLEALKSGEFKVSVSGSIMEYLGREDRHLNRVSEYDRMAIRYGYMGEYPEEDDWFCTDEDVADLGKPENSAECLRSDSTKDPFGFYKDRLRRAAERLASPGSSSDPKWIVKDIAPEILGSLKGMALYAVSAEETSDTWTAFNTVEGRPSADDPEAIQAWVLDQILEVVCGDAFQSTMANAPTGSEASITIQNENEFRNMAGTLLAGVDVFKSSDLKCIHPQQVVVSE
jgi:hypothetical protein